MRCRTADRLMSLQLDHALGVEELARLSRHLEQCARCRAHWASMQRANRLLQQAPWLEVPAGLPAKVLQRLPADRRAVVPAEPVWARASLVVMAAVALLLVALAGVGVLSGVAPGQSDWLLAQQGGRSVIVAVWESVILVLTALAQVGRAVWQGLRWPWAPILALVVGGAAYLWRWLWRRSSPV